MKSPVFLALLVHFSGAFGWAADKFPSPDAQAGKPAKEVRQQYGQPVRIPRQILYRRHIEQWVYENPRSIRVQVSCSRSDEPVVTRVIPSRNGSNGGKN
jgi:hypothetical protein